LDIEQLLHGWEAIMLERDQYPDKGRYGDSAYASVFAERAMSWSAKYEPLYRADPLLETIHYDFGLLEALHGLQAKKRWAIQARRIKKAKRRYGIS